MSGIYIPGMEMPTSCAECPCNKDDGFGFFTCGVTKSECDFISLPTNCPLVPVPEHRRLIDADALAKHKFVCIPHVTINGKEAGNAYRLGWNTAIEAIMENAETIIGGE